jgi:hypothetical protein
MTGKNKVGDSRRGEERRGEERRGEERRGEERRGEERRGEERRRGRTGPTKTEKYKSKIREQKKSHEKWKNAVSDLLTWLNAIGAYSYSGATTTTTDNFSGAATARDAFCMQHFLHAKVIECKSFF